MTAEPNKPNIPQPPSSSGGSELEEALEGLREYGTPIMTGLLAAAVVVGGFQFYRWHKNSARAEASQRLNTAANLTQLQDIVDQYGSTPSGPIAQLALAAGYYTQGQYSQAQQIYTTFSQTYPEHPMCATAEFAIGRCQEAAGQSDLALDTFKRFIAQHADHYLAPVAELAQGRCLEEQGKLEAARVHYEDFIAAHPDSPWATEAESLLRFVEKDLRARNAGPPGPATTDSESPAADG